MQAAKRLLPLSGFWLILNYGTMDSQNSQLSGSHSPRQTKTVLAQPASQMLGKMQSGGKVSWASCRSS